MLIQPIHPLEGKTVLLEYTRGERSSGRVRSACVPYGLKFGRLLEPLIPVHSLPWRLENWDAERLYRRLLHFLRGNRVERVYVPTWAPEVCGITLGRVATDDRGERWYDIDTLDRLDSHAVRFVLDGINVCWFNTRRGEILCD